MLGAVPSTPPAVVHVLEEDPGLGAALGAADRAAATERLVATELHVPRGGWEGDHALGTRAGDLGFLVLDGLLVRRTELGRHAFLELLGSGDLVRPWDVDEPGAAPVAASTCWRIAEASRFAVLDARFAAAAGRFPPLTAALLSRVVRRAHLLATLLAVASMPRLDARLLTVLWQLADRWGRVGHEGTVVPMRLTHETLAGLVGAQRPSVTTALRALERRELVRRGEGGGWVLLGDPPDDPERAVGE